MICGDLLCFSMRKHVYPVRIMIGRPCDKDNHSVTGVAKQGFEPEINIPATLYLYANVKIAFIRKNKSDEIVLASAGRGGYAFAFLPGCFCVFAGRGAPSSP